jgi:hypothetical protein
MTESFPLYRQIGTPRDQLSLIDCLPSQAVRGGPLGPTPYPEPGSVIAATLAPPPKKYGVTHWSSRLLVSHLGGRGRDGGPSVVSARHPALAVETFKFSTDPKLVATVTDIIGSTWTECRRLAEPRAVVTQPIHALSGHPLSARSTRRVSTRFSRPSVRRRRRVRGRR